MAPSTRGDVISEYVDGGSFSRNKLIKSRETLFGGDDGSSGAIPEQFPKSGLSAAQVKQLNKDDVTAIVEATTYSEQQAQSKLHDLNTVKSVILDYVK